MINLRRTVLSVMTGLALGATLLMGWPAQAQSKTLGLSDDDYALLSAANKTAVKSYTMDYVAQLTIKGFPTFAIDANLTGAATVDRTAHALDFTVTGPLQLGTAQNIATNADVKWIGNALYFNPGDGWQTRADASKFLSQWIQRILGLSVNGAALSKWDTSSISGLKTIWQTWLKIDPSTILTAKRLDDATVGDAKTEHFQISTDVYSLMKSPGFLNFLLSISRARGTALQALAHAKAMATVIGYAEVFKNGKLTLDQYVGADDKLIHRETIAIDLPLDPSTHKNSEAPFVISASLDMTFSGQNQPQTVAAPDGAKTVTALAFPPDVDPAPAGSGTTEYVYVETIPAKGDYKRTFEAKANDKVTITARGIGLDFEPIAKLLGPDGKLLGEDDGYDANGFALFQQDAQITVPIPADGTYSADVTEYGKAAGSFIVTITIVR